MIHPATENLRCPTQILIKNKGGFVPIRIAKKGKIFFVPPFWGGFLLNMTQEEKHKITKSKSAFESVNLANDKKIKAYQKARREIHDLLKGETHPILKMASINCMLRENLPYYFWTGFYLVHKNELVVGPYQGTLGCLHIKFGKGVCGTAAITKQTQIVPDVNLFPGHIACDSKSKSEIVVPVFDKSKNLIAVFDVDSTKLGSFDEIDKKYLEGILKEQFEREEIEN